VLSRGQNIVGQQIAKIIDPGWLGSRLHCGRIDLRKPIMKPALLYCLAGLALAAAALSGCAASPEAQADNQIYQLYRADDRAGRLDLAGQSVDNAGARRAYRPLVNYPADWPTITQRRAPGEE
jgi:hypothetical protein